MSDEEPWTDRIGQGFPAVPTPGSTWRALLPNPSTIGALLQPAGPVSNPVAGMVQNPFLEELQFFSALLFSVNLSVW